MSRCISLPRKPLSNLHPRLSLTPSSHRIAFHRTYLKTRSILKENAPAIDVPRPTPSPPLSSLLPFSPTLSNPSTPFPPTTSSNDTDLKAAFDTPSSRSSLSSSEPTGLFGYTSVTHPTSLRPLTERTIYHAQHIVERIRKALDDVTGRELRLVVKNLDRLSDLLCGVIDMAELVRNVHPDPTWVEESDKAYERLCSFMNELNTDTRLYQSLKLALQHPHPTPLSEAERQVALTFLRDFEKSGIHLPPDLRSRFVSQSDSLLSLGRTFLNDASSGPSLDPPIEIPEADRLLVGMGSAFISSLPRGKGKSRSSVFVTPGSWESQMIARYARTGEARRLVYVGSLRPDPDRIQILEQMLLERAELANLLGKETWADVALVDKMAKTPGNVMNFLTSLAEHNRPAAATDIVMLQKMKASALTGNPFASETIKLPPIYAWDKDFFSERHMMSLSPVSSLPPITPYFSTGNIMLGLSRLFSKLYGISFKPVSVEPGEIWHPSVRRLDVVDEEEGIIGVVYCDLFSREGKPPSAAHYTVRCSRRVDDDDLLGDGLESYWDSKYGKGLEVEGEKVRGREGKYQLPIVVLTTDCGVVEEGRPAVLGWNDVETLFHEMGHAIHSMIGRTEYHNVSGTRCATDFVELPSILMEHFVSSPSVLSLFATHHTTNQPLPLPLLEAHLDIRDSLSSLETHGQILMAILDQRYHTIHHGDPFDSTKIHYDLQESLGVVPPVEGTAWQTQFGHLHGYGATYYSYLFDRAIAGKIWHSLFASNGGLSREGGEKFKDEVLRWGGGKDPWEMVANVIGGKEGDKVLKGDEGAMKVVGGWMIK